MKNILKIKEPFISLIVTGQKNIVTTIIDTKFEGGTVYLMCSGIDYDFCEKYDIPSSNYTEDNIGKLLAVMYLGAKTKTNYMEVSKLFKKTLDDPGKFLNCKNIFRFNIGKKVSMYDKSIDYITKYGEPEKFDDWLFTTSNEFRYSVISRRHESGEITDFKSPVTCVLQDCTSNNITGCMFHNSINTYMGCEHDCKYCYVKTNYGYNGMWTKEPIPANIKDIEEPFYDAFNTVKSNVLIDIIRKRQPVKIGISTDPLQPIERKEKVTLKTIKMLNSYDYPYVIISKGIVEPELLDVMCEMKDNFLFQQTLLTLDKDITKKLEPGAPSPQERLDNIKRLTDEGIIVQVRIEPWLVGVHTNEKGYLLDNKLMDEFIGTLKSVGVRHIISRHYARNTMTDIFLEEILGINYADVYKKQQIDTLGHCFNDSGKKSDKAMVPDTTVDIRFAKQMRKILDKYDMTYAPRKCAATDLFSAEECCSFNQLSNKRRIEWTNNSNWTLPIFMYRALQAEPDTYFTSQDFLDLGILRPATDKAAERFHEVFADGFYHVDLLNTEVVFDEEGKQKAIKYGNGKKRYTRIFGKQA